MSLGPGKYDEWCTKVREATAAKGVLLMVIAGNMGEGFSLQASVDVTLKLPRILRDVANQIEQIEADFKQGKL